MKLGISIYNEERPFTMPNYAHEGDAGMDVYASINESIPLFPHQILGIGTNVQLEIPKGYEVQVRSKSGLALNYGVVVLNSPGTVDESFKSEIKVILINHSEDVFYIHPNSKIAQLVLAKVETAEIEFVKKEDISSSTRGEGGFGSTGLTASKESEASK